ncbi:MAG TPA: hypothetical protein VMV94_14140 [Phycisphaerae bacterium]|nr:hypothetical protein [Phycisphaerae bacterium]
MRPFVTTADAERHAARPPRGGGRAAVPWPIVLVALQIPWALAAGCEEEQLPPPRSPATAPAAAELDRKHTASIKADRNYVIPNLQFVVQRDPVGTDMTGFTLLSTRPGPDDSRLLFGTTQNLSSLDKLTSIDIRFAGARLLDPHGNGIFTTLACYQPKFVTLKIRKVDAGEAQGTLSGEFYRFKTVTPTAKPDVVRLEATFTAVLIVK